MEDMLQYWSTQITSLDFWKNLLDSFEGLGPLVPVLLAMVESFVPPFSITVPSLSSTSWSTVSPLL